MGINMGLAGLVLAMLLLTACGGGGDGGAVLADTPSDDMPLDDTPSTAQQAHLVVVRYDHDADGHPDVMTLDAAARPMTIVEALLGMPEGDSIDGTETLAGQPIDLELSDVLASYLADSYAVGTETDLDVALRGEPTTITVIE